MKKGKKRVSLTLHWDGNVTLQCLIMLRGLDTSFVQWGRPRKDGPDSHFLNKRLTKNPQCYVIIDKFCTSSPKFHWKSEVVQNTLNPPRNCEERKKESLFDASLRWKWRSWPDEVLCKSILSRSQDPASSTLLSFDDFEHLNKLSHCHL